VNEFIQVIVSGILIGGIYVVVAMGLSLMFGVTKIINFAHGEFLMLGMYAAYFIYKFLGIEPYTAIFIITPLFIVIGMIIYKLVINPIVDRKHEIQIFATLGLSIVFQNMALFLWSADFRTVNLSYSTATVSFGDITISLARLIAFLAAAVITAAMLLLLKYTYVGKALRAVSQQNTAAELMGIKVKRIYLIAFSIGIALAGIAGALLMPVFYAFPTVGAYFSLAAFVVVVMGGMGDVTGALIAGLIIGIVESLSGFYVAAELKEAIYFVLFIIILFIKPNGLFARKEAK